MKAGFLGELSLFADMPMKLILMVQKGFGVACALTREITTPEVSHVIRHS